ncbi:unnamed protein product [Rhizoctonia solani]|uniref:Uncharacterized protein n=1 Tax=Rhizoctonia solani TaxID=456999 RepID=A0A8H3HYJ2_9AGAM|nr:unnamed protein product [Rhizoctonia solani]CAE7145077.1 unnamed protein product [Rhizoctonia solani]
MSKIHFAVLRLQKYLESPIAHRSSSEFRDILRELIEAMSDPFSFGRGGTHFGTVDPQMLNSALSSTDHPNYYNDLLERVLETYTRNLEFETAHEMLKYDQATALLTDEYFKSYPDLVKSAAGFAVRHSQRDWGIVLQQVVEYTIMRLFLDPDIVRLAGLVITTNRSNPGPSASDVNDS